MYCPKCGKENPDDAKFCSSCGCELTPLRTDAFPQQGAPTVVPPGSAAPVRPREKKNTTALVLGIIGAICAFLGGVFWASCADLINCSKAASETDGMWLYSVLFVVLGIGGAVISLIGSIQAYNYGRGRFVLSLIGLLFEAGCLAVQILLLMSLGEKGHFLLMSLTIVALILLLTETIFSALRNPNKKRKESDT